MSKILQIKIFNDILDQLIDYLENNFYFFRSDLVLCRSTIEFVRHSNPRLVVEQFMSYVGPYKSYIFSCDEEFFLHTRVDTIVPKDSLGFVSKVRNIWLSNDISDTQKAHVWLYFQKLLRAGEKV
jgi:hypothetical protein